MAKRKKSAAISLTPFLWILGIIAFISTTIVLVKVFSVPEKLFPLHLVPLLGGLIFECKRITRNWGTVGIIFLFAFFFSQIAFLPGRGETHYYFARHAEMWPYYFMGLFIVGVVSLHEKIVTPKLTEGITLIQSLSIVYWVIEMDFFSSDKLWISIPSWLIIIPTVFSLLHSFTYIHLSRNMRFSLSLWSSIIMLILAIDHIYRVYQNEFIENSEDFYRAGFIGFQFFLLGVSSIYMGQNFLMIVGFLPSNRQFFNAEYFRCIKQLKNQHVERYSNKQVSKRAALGIACSIVVLLLVNYFYKLVNPQLAIWTVIFVVPPIIHFFLNRKS